MRVRALALVMTLKGIFTALAGALPLVRPARPQQSVRSAHKSSPTGPARMSASQQWEKVSGVLTAAIGSATQARELQESAAQQLDLATYALYSMFDELSAVMSEPLVREAAVVHRLPPKARRAQVRALAA